VRFDRLRAFEQTRGNVLRDRVIAYLHHALELSSCIRRNTHHHTVPLASHARR
jgi:hypothetical protein